MAEPITHIPSRRSASEDSAVTHIAEMRKRNQVRDSNPTVPTDEEREELLEALGEVVEEELEQQSLVAEKLGSKGSECIRNSRQVQAMALQGTRRLKKQKGRG